MSEIKTYDVASMLIDEAVEQFGRLWVVTEQKMNELKAICEDLDAVIDEFECESADMSINDDTLDMIIELTCFDMVFSNPGHGAFLSLIRRVNSFGFASDGDSIKVRFILSGVFDKKK